ncbi:bud13 like protein [Quercus suber]|uniref:Bud13 like protein n=1 Tax=Quercus suber TaxID=58331 RepID=A0AAW0JLC4_QUESU
MAAAASSGSNSLKEYLKRYGINDEEDKKKKKKKKKVQSKPDATGLLVVDEDPVWQKTVNLEEENSGDSADEEKPQVNEDIEVKRMRRLEQLRARRAYNAISEDGSGWVSLSPKCLNSNDPNSDMSPPRKQRIRNDTPSPEPEQDFGRDNIDLSPPRLNLNNDMKDLGRPGSPDLSPPRRRLTETNASHASLLPDLSPPRKSRKEAAVEEQRKTGLISGKDMREEIARTKKNDLLRFNEMDPSISGRGAEPTYRDKKGYVFLNNVYMLDWVSLLNAAGERISKEEFLKQRKKVKVEEKPKGLAQKREAEARLQELESEKDKPFARTRDDPELDKMLRERIRDVDPMAHLVKAMQKKRPELVLPNLGDNEKMKESGFVVPQDIPDHSWLKRRLDAAPNRYGIRPGRHWDGVDRSNGFEKGLFKRMNEKRATETEAYLWSVSDM